MSLARAAYDGIFPRYFPKAHFRANGSAGDVTVTWLGTATHIIRSKQTTLVIDPYVTRTKPRRLLAPLRSDGDAIARWIPTSVDAVLCGHSHFDHLLDAPAIALKTGARVVGSQTTCAFARAAGVAEEKLSPMREAGGEIRIGDFDVRFVPSLHGRILLGRVPFPGEVHGAPALPARAWHYRMGGAFGIHVTHRGVSIYHNGSADLIDAALADLRADVVLVGLAGRWATRNYLKRLLDALEPRTVIPTHHDAFFSPLEDGLRLLPGIDIDGFASETKTLAPRARLVVPDYDEAVAVA